MQALRLRLRPKIATMTEPLLLTATQISTFDGTRLLTRASGFFFLRDERLFLVTSRHVLMDKPSKHFPNRIEIELHIDAGNLTRSTGFSVLLYQDGKSIWHQGKDPSGEIDVAVIELDRSALPASVALRAFTPDHLQASLGEIEVGTALLIVGFPLGFHDTMHHLPVVRHAVIASARCFSTSSSSFTVFGALRSGPLRSSRNSFTSSATVCCPVCFNPSSARRSALSNR